MARPVVNDIAERLYAEIAPVTVGDEARNWPLLKFLHGWTNAMVLIEQVARDSDAGPGWSSVMNPDTAPALFLDWLSRMVGSRPIKGETEVQARARINAMSGLRRGSAVAIRNAVVRTLTGTKYNLLQERLDGDAYLIGIRTLASETPNPASLLAELLEQKPGGILLTYATITTNTYDTIHIGLASYQAVKDRYATYTAMRDNLP